MEKGFSAKKIAELLQRKGFVNTSKWISFALESPVPILKDLDEIFNAVRSDARTCHQEYYPDSKVKDDFCTTILQILLVKKAKDPERFYALTKQLSPTIKSIIESDIILEDIVNVAKGLNDKPKFYMICFYYMTLWEGVYKNVRKNLYALDECKNGKNVDLTEALEVVVNGECTTDRHWDNVLPDRLRMGKHKNYRNSIAHAHFKYIDSERMMQFWDTNPRDGQYSMKPVRLRYDEFFNYLLEVNIFCELFGIVIMIAFCLQEIGTRMMMKSVKKR